MVKVAVAPEPKAAGTSTKKRKLYKSTHGKRNKPKVEVSETKGNISDNLLKISQEKVKSPNTKKSQYTSKNQNKNTGKKFNNNANWKGQVAVKEEEFDLKEEIQDNTVNSTTPDSIPSVARKTASKVASKVASKEEIDLIDYFKFLQSEPKRTKCIDFEGKWSQELPEKPSYESATVPLYLIPKIKKYTDNLFDLEMKNYERKLNTSKGQGENMWMKRVMKSGTIQDKISTFIVQIQTSPLHSINVLEKLISFMTLKCRRNCYLVMDALLNIFETDLLIPDIKLTPFEKQPFHALQQLSKGNSEARDNILLIWLFEQKVKSIYSRFLMALSEINKDVLEKTKMKVMYVEKKLLIINPESEQILLERLVNRFGEPLRSVAAKAMLYLKVMLEENPVMQGVVVKEVERLLYRDNISEKAKYFCICFLSQLMFDHDGREDVAGRVIVIYFSFFDLSVKKGEVETKIMSSLLTGVNRAFPFTSMNNKELDDKIETIYKLVYLVGFNISIQALCLLFQILGSKKGLTDRYYNALYKKILAPELEFSSKQIVLFNLLFNSIKQDKCVERVRSFIKRMLQACESLPANSAAGMLFIISEILKARRDVDMLLKVATEETGAVDLSRFDYSDDDDDEHFKDVEEDEVDEEMKGKTKSSAPGVIFRKKSAKSLNSEYDPLQRNPLFAHADKAAFWEFSSLLRHFHPSVVLFAKHLSNNVPIVYPGDPLADFTLTKFLERFSFKNPKKPKEIGDVTVFARKKMYWPVGIKTIQPGSAEYMSRYADNMPEDEKFLYRFFLAKQKRADDKKSKEADDDNDDESISAEIDNDNWGDVDFSEGLKEMAGHDPALGGESDEDESDDDEGSDVGMGFGSDADDDSEPELDEDNAGFKDLSSGDDDDEEEGEGDGNKKMLREEDIEFSNDDDDDDDDEPPKKKSKSLSKKKEKKTNSTKKPKYDLDNYSIVAESFGEMLETNKESGMSNSVVVKGKPVSARQLAWEKKTEDLMRGRDHWKGGKYKKINRNKKMGKKKFGKKK